MREEGRSTASRAEVGMGRKREWVGVRDRCRVEGQKWEEMRPATAPDRRRAAGNVVTEQERARGTGDAVRRD
jgi:hypothetical protein